jgi:hypothetical protein
MRHYLRRKDTLNQRHRSGFYSEQFLRAAIPEGAIKHNHRSWMFCKMGRISTTRTKQSVKDWWRSLRTRTARSLPSMLYGLRVPFSCVLYVPEAQGRLPPGRLTILYARRTRTSLGRAVRAAYCGTTGGGTPEMPGPNAPCGSWAGSSASTSCATGAAEAAVATAPIAVSAAWAEPTCATTALGAPGPKAPRSTWSVSSSLRTRM